MRFLFTTTPSLFADSQVEIESVQAGGRFVRVYIKALDFDVILLEMDVKCGALECSTLVTVVLAICMDSYQLNYRRVLLQNKLMMVPWLSWLIPLMALYWPRKQNMISTR